MNALISAEKLEILIVDDRPENLLALEAVLQSPDYQLIRANSGDEALKYLLDHEPALILMDVQMPELDGFETATIIKKSDRLREVPIIFITAINKDDQYAYEGYSHGAVDYIFKPYDAHILRSKVSVFVDLARKNRRLLEMERKLRETERKDRERQIAQLELKSLRREQADQKRYRELVEGIPHGIVWSADAESLHLTFASQSTNLILGIPTDEWVADPFALSHVIPSDDWELFQECIRKVRETGDPEKLDHRMIHSRGGSIWVQTDLRIARNHDDNTLEIRALTTDVTKVKEAEIILKKSKLRSDLLAQASMALSESLDPDRVLGRLARILVPQIADGYIVTVPQENEATPLVIAHGKTFPGVDLLRGQIFQTTQPILVRNIFDPGLRKMGVRSVISIPLRTRDKSFGTLTLVTSDSERIFDETDLALTEDLSYRIAMALDNSSLYRRAQNAVGARDEFLSVASHELKTPLTPLKLHTQGLLKALRKNPANVSTQKITSALENSERQVSRLSDLVEDLLDVSRISVGKMSFSPESFDFSELVREILERYQGQASAAGCEITLKAPEHLIVHWDPIRIEQVFINLLTNALKYGAGKPVSVSLQEFDDHAQIIVRDQGIGISPDAQSKIFGRFERAVNGNYYSGLGLGLYIVQEILRGHRGEISVTSELGQGATFTICIPLHISASETAMIPSGNLKPVVSVNQSANR